MHGSEQMARSIHTQTPLGSRGEEQKQETKGEGVTFRLPCQVGPLLIFFPSFVSVLVCGGGGVFIEVF